MFGDSAPTRICSDDPRLHRIWPALQRSVAAAASRPPGEVSRATIGHPPASNMGGDDGAPAAP